MWIEWHGGNCPVHEGTIVAVRFRDGWEHPDNCTSTADSWDWRHSVDHPGEDIIAYRIVERHFLDLNNSAPLRPTANARV